MWQTWLPAQEPASERRARESLSCLAWSLILLIRAYQWTLRPISGGQCRFYPSCSDYAIGAIKKHGVLRGVVKSVARVLRCHPFHPGGYDPP
jgi:putative membrane protein insertion efficiency factor